MKGAASINCLSIIEIIKGFFVGVPVSLGKGIVEKSRKIVPRII